MEKIEINSTEDIIYTGEILSQIQHDILCIINKEYVEKKTEGNYTENFWVISPPLNWETRLNFDQSDDNLRNLILNVWADNQAHIRAKYGDIQIKWDNWDFKNSPSIQLNKWSVDIEGSNNGRIAVYDGKITINGYNREILQWTNIVVRNQWEDTWNNDRENIVLSVKKEWWWEAEQAIYMLQYGDKKQRVAIPRKKEITINKFTWEFFETIITLNEHFATVNNSIFI